MWPLFDELVAVLENMVQWFHLLKVKASKIYGKTGRVLKDSICRVNDSNFLFTVFTVHHFYLLNLNLNGNRSIKYCSWFQRVHMKQTAWLDVYHSWQCIWLMLFVQSVWQTLHQHNQVSLPTSVPVILSTLSCIITKIAGAGCLQSLTSMMTYIQRACCKPCLSCKRRALCVMWQLWLMRMRSEHIKLCWLLHLRISGTSMLCVIHLLQNLVLLMKNGTIWMYVGI